MSAILKFDFQNLKQLPFPEVNYLNYTKKDPILHVATTFSLKQGETRTRHGPIPHPLRIKPKGDKNHSCISSYPFQVLIIDWFIMFENQAQVQADFGTFCYN